MENQSMFQNSFVNVEKNSISIKVQRELGLFQNHTIQINLFRDLIFP